MPLLCLLCACSAMGNCLHRVESSFSLDSNGSDDFYGNYNWSYSYEDDISSDDSVAAAAPCYSCNLLDDSSTPFFVIASVLGVLTSGATLFALLRPLFHWQICPSRPILAQLAVGSALFSIVVPILAPGINSTNSTALCYLGHWVWNSSAFAQALLIGCHACLNPKLSIVHVPGLTLGLTVGLWGAAALLGLPITLASEASHGLCTLTSNRALGALRSTHAAICFTIFSLLPLGFLAAKGLKKALSKGPGPWFNVLWIWFIFWWPHGVVLGFDTLVRAKVFLLPTCLAQQVLDLMLQLTEALAILHCVATPLLLGLFFYKATHASLSSLSLPAGQSSHLDTFAGKS